MNILGIITGFFGIGEKYIEQKTKIKEAELKHELVKIESKTKIEEAKGNAAIEMAAIEQSETFNLDKMAIQQMEKDWKDDAFALFFFFILFGSFIPQVQPYIGIGLNHLNNLPDYIMYGLGLMFVHVFGFRNLLRLFLKRKGLINDERVFK